jgi:hypothetical protein
VSYATGSHMLSTVEKTGADPGRFHGRWT